MRIGFYAPLKTPLHSKPSGDREIGRLLLKALKVLGHDVEIISSLRGWEGRGITETQKSIRQAASNEVKQLLNKYLTNPAPELMFTYHVYHKAPDWIGSELATVLGIPYIIAEASFAPKQLNGPWHQGHLQTQKCIQQADRILALNPADVECLLPLLENKHKIDILKPFLDDTTIPGNDSLSHQSRQQTGRFDSKTINLITVAMMRDGDKRASYKQLAETLKKIDKANWRLTIVGDGDAAVEIKNYFKDLENKCTFTGKLGRQAIYSHLSNSDIFVWPAINEALGLALLEAQAFALPVVTQDYGGVSTIVEDSVSGYVTNPDNCDEFLNAVKLLISNTHTRQRMSLAAKSKFTKEHSFEVALARLKAIFDNLNIH